MATPARDPIAQLFGAMIKNAMEDLGCAGTVGGVKASRREGGGAYIVRFIRAARFVNSEDFDRACLAAGFAPETWRAAAWRQLRTAAAARLRPAVECRGRRKAG